MAVRKVRHESGLPAWQSGTRNSYYKAWWLEHGVGPHDLKPKRARVLDTPEGPRAGAHSPGFAGAYMTAKAAEVVEAELPAIAAPRLSTWAQAFEERANAGGRVK